MENIFTPEQLEKLKACRSEEEIAAFAKENGSELSDEELEKVAGGIDNELILNMVLETSCTNYKRIKHFEKTGWVENGVEIPDCLSVTFYSRCMKCVRCSYCKCGQNSEAEYRKRVIRLGWEE